MIRKIMFTLLIALLVGTVSVGSVSAGQDTVTVCHKPGTPAEATLEIAAPALDAHLGHGDYEGECHGPESAGCAALNALVPDPQMVPYLYSFGVSGLDFLPGETIHVDLTYSTSEEVFMAAFVAVGDDIGGALAIDDFGWPYPAPPTGGTFGPGQQTLSVDYVVVAGDGADEAGAIFVTSTESSITLVDMNFSCTPAS